MKVPTSRHYQSLANQEKALKNVSKLLKQTTNVKVQLFRFRVYGPTNDQLKASARFEVRKLTEGKLRDLRRQFESNNTEGDRVVLRCRDGTLAPHQEILRAAWTGFLDGKSSFRIDFHEYALRDIRNLVSFVYTNNLPLEQEELLSLLTVSHRLGYSALSVAGARTLVDLSTEANLTNVHILIEQARKFELKSLYDRLCVVLARNFQHKTLMHSFDADILKDILNQNCLAVFSEEEVLSFVLEYGANHGGVVPFCVTRCIRANYLQLPLPENFEVWQEHDAEPRDSFKAFFVDVSAKFRHGNGTIAVKFKVKRKANKEKSLKLCVLKQNQNKLHPSKHDFEFPVCVVSCKSQYFVQLGGAVVMIDPCTHRCEVVCSDVQTLEVCGERVELISKHCQRMILSMGPSTVLQSFRIRTPCHKVEPSIVIGPEFKTELDNETFSSVIQLNEKLVLH